MLKRFILWRHSSKKTFKESSNLWIFLFKNDGWISIWLCICFAKILPFLLKTISSNRGLSKAIFWPFRLVLFGLTMFFETLATKALIWMGSDHLDHLSSKESVLVLNHQPSKTYALPFQTSKSCIILEPVPPKKGNQNQNRNRITDFTWADCSIHA